MNDKINVLQTSFYAVSLGIWPFFTQPPLLTPVPLIGLLALTEFVVSCVGTSTSITV